MKRIIPHAISILPSSLFSGILLTLFMMLGSLSAISQDRPETQVRTLIQLAEQWNQQQLEEKLHAAQKATLRSFPLRFENEEGVVFELMRFESGMPEYYTTTNARAAISTATNHLQKNGRTQLNLTGEGMIAGEWDAGAVLASHQELVGRVVQRDGATNVHNHAVHVAGTLIASGVNPEARGMAPEALLWAHDWNNDSGEMAQAAADGLLISNHSYGSLAGWAFGDWSGESAWHWWGDISIDEEEDFRFGYYDHRASQWDQISYLAPQYLIVKSAGNNRNDNHSGVHYVFDPELGDWVESDAFRQPDGGAEGYDCLPTYSNAKNILTVGAVQTVSSGYSEPSDVRMSNFSSWGPTNDGRIKPDLVGDGVGLLSSNGNGIASYNTSSGTSMSGPNVAGSLLLLQELHDQMHGEFMWSSTLKGLAIHTTDKTGRSAGPDYEFGWGLLNAERAAQLLIDSVNHRVLEATLQSGDTLQYEFYGNGMDEVKVTLCWTDPPATPLPRSLNDTTLRLINDLDMRIIALSGADSGSVYHPYILDPANPSAEATTGDNFRDNVEVIFPGILPGGNYVVQITHKGDSLYHQSQHFSLILSAPPADCRFDLVVDSVRNPTCPGEKDGEVTLTSNGAMGDVLYSSDGTHFQTDSFFSGQAAALNFFYATDSMGCTATASVALPPPPAVHIQKNNLLTLRVEKPMENRRPFGFSNSFISSDWGGDPTEVTITAPVIAVDDGSDNGFLACDSLANAEAINGNIAIALRGSCQFSAKALNAQEAGARALIIINDDGNPMNMGPGDFANEIEIPVFMLSTIDGTQLYEWMQSDSVVLTLGNNRAVTNVSCPYSEDGELSPFVFEGLPPYQFQWSTGDQTEQISGLSPGNYELEVTDSLGCSFVYSMTVGVPDSLEIVIDQLFGTSCPGIADGQVLLTGSGGVPPYTFVWEDDFNGPARDSLVSGYYRLTLTDNHGCELSDSIYIPTPENFEITEISTKNSCREFPGGVAEITLTGGSVPYQIQWLDMDFPGFIRDSLAPGVYHFTALDACGMEVSDSLEIREKEDLSVNWKDHLIHLCERDSTGEIHLDIRGGGQPIEIAWSTGDSTESIQNLAAGWYSFTLTDDCGTHLTDSIQLLYSDSLQVQLIEKVDVSCPGGANGQIAVEVIGAVGGYRLNWNTGDSTSLVQDLSAGTYHLTVTDSIACTTAGQFTIQQPDTFTLDFEIVLEEITVSMVNHSDSVVFLWDFGDGNTSESFNPTHTYESDGEYEICLLAYDSCDSIVVCNTVEIVGTQAKDLEVQPISIYPNPGSDWVTIKIPDANTTKSLIIYNSVGRIIQELPEKETVRWRVAGLPAGMYIIKRGNQYSKFIRQ